MLAKQPTPDGVLFETLVPVGQSRVLLVKGYGITLSDSAQNALTNNHHAVPFALTSASQTLRYTYRVTPAAAGAK